MKFFKRILPIVCGFVLLFGSCLTVSAAETNDVPTWEDLLPVGLREYTVIVLSPTNQYKLYTSDYEFYIKDSEYGEMVCSGPSNGGGYIDIYNFDKNNQQFVFSENMTGTYVSLGYANSSSLGTFQYSSHTIYKNNAVFFQGCSPLKTWVLPVVGQVRVSLTTILPIAVFCLASVMLLVILRRKLPRFLRV